MAYWLSTFDGLAIPGYEATHDIGPGQARSGLIELPGGRLYDALGADLAASQARQVVVRGELVGASAGDLRTQLDAWLGRRGKRATLTRVSDDNTTNLVTNPSFETGTSGWSIYNDAGGDLAVSQSADYAFFGAYSAKFTWTSLNNSQFSSATSVTAVAGQSYSAQCRIRGAGAVVRMAIQHSGAPYTQYAYVNVTTTTDWQRITCLYANAAGGVPLRVQFHVISGSGPVYVDAVQLEAQPSPTAYCDGDQPGCSWTGTPHASTSVRGVNTVTARLLAVRASRQVGQFLWLPIELQFEVVELPWRGVLRQATVPLSAHPTTVTLPHAGNAPIHNPIITFTAGSASLTQVYAVMYPASGQCYWGWNGTIAAGKSLVVDCGAATVRNDGADAYAGFYLHATGHQQEHWATVEPGGTLVHFDYTGGGTGPTVTYSYYEGWA